MSGTAKISSVDALKVLRVSLCKFATVAATALEVLAQRGRLPADTKKIIAVGDFYDELKNRAHADIHIFGFSNELDLKLVRRIAESVNGSCLFVRASGSESALA